METTRKINYNRLSYYNDSIPTTKLFKELMLACNDNLKNNSEKFERFSGILAHLPSGLTNVDCEINRDNLVQILIKTLFASPLEYSMFEEIKNFMEDNPETWKQFISHLFNHESFCNLQKMAYLLFQDDFWQKKIEEYVCEILDVESLDHVTLKDIQKISELNAIENTFKFFTVFKNNDLTKVGRRLSKMDNRNDKFFQSDNEISNFIKLAVAVVQSEMDFQDILKTYIDELSDKETAYFQEQLITDLSVLLQLALSIDNKTVIHEILNCECINIYKLRVPVLGLRFSTIVANNGAYKLLKIYIERMSQIKRNKHLFRLFNECLVTPDMIQYNIPLNFEKDSKICIDMITEDREFELLPEKFNLMHQAVALRNNYAIKKLVDKFRLNTQFLQEMNKYSLEQFLDSNISEYRDEYNISRLKIDYDFLGSDFAWKESLGLLKTHSDLRELITHPVISTFVNFKIQQFKRVYILNFIFFIALFITPVWYCFQYTEPLGMWIACVYIFIRELLQLLILMISFSDHHNYYGKKNVCEEFCKSKANIVESLLFLSSASAVSTMYLDDLLYYKLFLVITILLSTIEIAILITAVFPSNGIYFFMLRTVLKTFLKTSLIFVLFIIAFAICFHVVFDDSDEKTDKENNTIIERLENLNESTFVNGKTEINFQEFKHWWITFVKTVVMLAGEFDAGNLKHQNFWLSPTFLFCFVFSSILFYNFINGLAIDDIQKLQEMAEFYDCKYNITSIIKHNNFYQLYSNDLENCVKYVIYKIVFGQAYETDSAEVTKINVIIYKNKQNKRTVTMPMPVGTYIKLKNIIKNRQNLEREQLKTKQVFSKLDNLLQQNEQLAEINSIKSDLRGMKEMLEKLTLDRSQ